MSNRLVTALLVKNEADKYLERVLKRCWEFSSDVLVLDDGSTDDSVRKAWGLGCQVRERRETGMWGNESPARAELWDWGAKEAGDGWLLIADADMLLQGDPRPLLNTTQHNAWSFVLYDLWDSETTYRLDGFWRGHEYPRPWLFRPSRLGYDTPIWPDRGLHTGHAPSNAQIDAGIAYPEQLCWHHLAYVTQPDRFRKHQQYLEKSHLLTPWEQAHAASVGD
jgi:hypothetical protein